MLFEVRVASLLCRVRADLEQVRSNDLGVVASKNRPDASQALWLSLIAFGSPSSAVVASRFDSRSEHLGKWEKYRGVLPLVAHLRCR